MVQDCRQSPRCAWRRSSSASAAEDQRICACCEGALHRIGDDVSEQLHIPPATPWVWQHVRFKYGCRHCGQHGISAPVVRAGIDLGRGTMGQWMIGAVDRHLQRLYQAMHQVLLAQPLIHGDETTVQVLLEDGRSAQSQSYMWGYRSAETNATPVVLFEYQAGPGQQHPQAFLRGYTAR